MINQYYWLTKPGIIYGNLVTAAAGFLLASKNHVNLWLFLATLVGVSFVIGSACVFNNYIDRHIDNKMTRTKKRALVQGSISGRNAIIFATSLGVIGFLLLGVSTNFLTVFIGLVGFADYIIFYSISKRRSSYGTLVGSIAGATPPVAGYCAVTNNFNGGALLLFLILVLWQMPHFYSIAMYRDKDYEAAGIPVLPIKRGLRITKIRIIYYIFAFSLASIMLTVFGYTGYFYLVVALTLSIIWFALGINGLRVSDDRLWARKMFLFSLVVIVVLSVMISTGTHLDHWV